jgi:hypothetical protein
MAFQLKDQIEDNLQDPIGKCLKAFNVIPTWTNAKNAKFDECLKLAKKENYLEFRGDFRDYHLPKKGQHCLYVVPLNQRGALQVFAGKKVRLICGGKWNQREGRIFLAQLV